MKKAVVLVSGGLDSATTLAVARDQKFDCYALSIDYGQRSRSELDAALSVGKMIGVADHQVISVDLRSLGRSALTDQSIDVPTTGIQKGIPVTYVPARNTIMLSLALAWAESLASQAIFIGVNAVDYSGYPDCRPEFIQTFEHMANVATKAASEGLNLKVYAPLINLSKREIIILGSQLNIDYSLTVSCYQADEHGLACGVCDACRLRKAGFSAADIPDPTRYSPICPKYE